MTILLAYWKPILAAVLAFAMVFGVLAYGGHRYRVGYNTGHAEVIAEDAKALAAERARNTAQEAAWAAQQKDAADAYQAEIDRLHLADIKPSPIVRLCLNPIGGGTVPSPSAAPGRPGSPTPTGGVVSPIAGPDIGGRLTALADRADQLSAQLRAVQAVCQ